jgi:hypothetical protein
MDISIIIYISRYMVNRKEKSIDERIQEFKEYYGEKSYHISGGWIVYPDTPNEKYTSMKIVKGPLRWSKCKLCNESLKEILKEDSKRRTLKFCSDECRKEHDEIKKIRKKLNAETIFWPPQKPPIPKQLLTYTIKGENGVPHKYKSRKIRKKRSQ